MTIQEAIRERHSVRRFTENPIGEQEVSVLRGLIDEANRESGLHIQLVLNEPESFNTLFAHYGRFANAVNYIAIVGPKDMPDLEEKAGYYGQKLVLEAQMMGLRTCWAGGSFSRGKCRAEIDEGEKNVLVIAIGYGQSDGKEHRSKPVEKVCTVPESEMWALLQTGKAPEHLSAAELSDIAKFASISSGLSVTRPGGLSSILSLEEVKRFL